MSFTQGRGLLEAALRTIMFVPERVSLLLVHRY